MTKVPAYDLSRRHMEKLGYFCERAEHYNSFTRRRHDMFGFVDMQCLGDNETVNVQSTSWANISSRVKKITYHENVGVVRKAGHRILVQGWKMGPKGRYIMKEIDCS